MGPKFEFFWLGLGYIMICDVTLVSVEVRNVMLINELLPGEARKVSQTLNLMGLKSTSGLKTLKKDKD